MRETTTFIKLDRNILRWRWFQDSATFHVFVYLILTANNEPSDFRDFTIQRGEVCCSVAKICEETGLSTKMVRNAIERLIKTGEISKKRQTQNHTIYYIEGYERYQAKPANEGQTKGKQRASEGQTEGNPRAMSKEYKEGEEEKKYKKYKNGERAPARVGARKESVASILDRMLAEAEAEEEAQREPSGNGTNNPDA